MFPEVPKDTIRQLRIEQNLSMNQVTDVLVSQLEKAKPPSLPALLIRHAQDNIDANDDIFIKTNRSCIWNKARVFYKRAITTSPSMLRKTLVIEFSGEEGSDAGALSFEIFQAVLQQMNDECFEGKEEKRIPRSRWGSELELEMAGAMIAHSILLGGPGFPCLHPAVFHSVVHGDIESGSIVATDLLTAEDIPLNAATIDLVEMIGQVHCIRTCYK